jgi:predicted nucleotidyltransferase component of viral defense system
MLFYGLPRMSVDLDFDLLGDSNTTSLVAKKISDIVSEFGRLDDYEDKFYTLYYELNYGFGDKNIKIEISKRGQSGKGIIQNFLGEQILIMDEPSLFTNKLIALLHRKAITNRDIFDIWYFLQK